MKTAIRVDPVDTTPNLALPYLAAAQSQKHVTHNDALRCLDALVQLSVLDRTLASPPPAPANGDRYIVAANPSGVWAGNAGAIAAFQDGAWTFFVPRPGWTVWVVAERLLIGWTAGGWVTVGPAAVNPAPLVGVNATADTTNRLAVKSPASLFDNVGNGHQLKVNKAAATDTASVLFQDGYSGRAEMGLTGDDNYHFKVSPDGATWKEALGINAATGAVTTAQGRTHAATGKAIGEYLATPGGNGVTTFWRQSLTARNANPRTAVVASISSTTISLTTATAGLFFDAYMVGVSYARIWNVTKSPNQSAWVAAMPTSSSLQVLAASDIASWSAGDTIQISDPITVTPNNFIAIDISPMMQSVLGAVFPQKAIAAKLNLTAALTAGQIVPGTPAGSISLSAAGATGGNTGPNLPSDGATVSDFVIVPCTTASPISNSNLVFIRETSAVAGTLGIAIGASVGLFA